MTRTQTPLQKIRPAARLAAAAPDLPAPAKLAWGMAKQAVHTAAILLSVALLAENALSQQSADDNKWYLEFNYSFDTLNYDSEGPDDPLDGLSDGDFRVAGIGIGYSFTPNWSIEGRYKSANTDTQIDGESTPETETEYRYEGTAVFEASYVVYEYSVVYQFAPEAKTSFHLRGGFQSFSADASLGIVEYIYNSDNTVREYSGVFATVENSLSSSAFFGAGVTFSLTPRWHIRSEYLVQDGGNLTSYSASAGFRF